MNKLLRGRKPSEKILGLLKELVALSDVPLVMHGGSGITPTDFKKVIEAGIRKINYYSYMTKAGYLAAKQVIESNRTSYLHDVEFEAMKAMNLDVKKAIKLFTNK